VSRWQSDEYAGMSYTYVPVGCPPIVYEKIAESVQDRLFFAGEVSFILCINKKIKYEIFGLLLSSTVSNFANTVNVVLFIACSHEANLGYFMEYYYNYLL